jgi:hypothetical protein
MSPWLHLRLSFPISSSWVIQPFDLIHCVLWASHVLNVPGYKYYLIIIDNCTHYSWTFLLCHKYNNTFPSLSHFFPMCQHSLVAPSSVLSAIMNMSLITNPSALSLPTMSYTYYRSRPPFQPASGLEPPRTSPNSWTSYPLSQSQPPHPMLSSSSPLPLTPTLPTTFKIIVWMYQHQNTL